MSAKERSRKQWVGCSIEAEYFGEERKSGKMDRKLAQAKDRSKHKKTDQKKEKQTAKISHENLLHGRVLSIESQGITVAVGEALFNCTLRGLLKKENTQLKNLVTVGDFVWIDPIHENEGQIAVIDERKTVLSRADNLSRRKEQLIAANVDQVLITTSVVSPPLKPFLIDRYIIAANKGGMDPVIIINKIDLLDGKNKQDELAALEEQIYHELVSIYQKAGIPTVATSIETGQGIEELKQLMKDRVSVFSGQSGVGKSSLINVVAGYELLTGEIVDRTQKGAHTTSSARLLPLKFGGWCVDTPGIKSFGIWKLDKEEVEHYFDEIFTCGHECRYPNCSHRGEKGCAVAVAVEKGEISPLRYASYEALLSSVEEEHRRR